MKTNFTIMFVLFLFQITFGQEKKNFINKPLSEIVIMNSFRIGIALQRCRSAEIGFARHEIRNPQMPHCANGFSPKGFYSSLEWIAKTEKYKEVFGLKVGYEIDLLYVSSAIEAKYQTNFDNNDFVITPKIGLGGTRFYSVFYGYNISINGNQFGNVGIHQFSLIFNLNNNNRVNKNLNR